MRKEIEEQAVIYRKTANSDFQIRVNAAAVELALGQPSLLRKGNRGDRYAYLLTLAPDLTAADTT